MNPLRMAAHELRRLTSGTLLRAAVVALVAIPMLYSGLYLYANHDPYGGLKNTPAALVMLDQGATLDDGSHLTLGADVAKTLQEDADLQWHRVDAATAAAGVQNGTYLFALTITSDFSQAVASTADRTASQHAVLQLTTNDSTNYVVHKVATSLGNTVAAEVDQKVGAKTNKAFLNGLVDVRTSLGDAVDGADTLSDGASKLSSGAKKLWAGTTKLLSGAAKISTGTDKVSTGASQLAAGTVTLHQGTTTLATGATKLVDGTATLVPSTRKLASGAKQVSTGAKKLSTGAKKLSTGAKKVAAASTQADAGASDLATATGQVSDGAASVASGAHHLSTGAAQVKQAVAAQLAAAGVDATTSATIVAEIGSLSTGADELDTGAAAVADGASATHTGAAQLAAGTAQLAAGADTLATKSKALATGAAKVSTGAAKVSTGATQLATKSTTLRSGIVKLGTGATQLDTGAGTLAAKTAQLASGTSTLATGASTLADGTSTLAAKTGTLATGAHKVATGATKLHNGLSDGYEDVPVVKKSTVTSISKTLADVVTVKDESLAKAANYGSGLAPFFLSLSAWIGGYVLFLFVKPFSTRAMAAGVPSWRIAIGGWLAPATLAATQIVVAIAAVEFLVGIHPDHPVRAFALLLLAAVAFVALQHALNAWLGTVGQYIGLVLMIVQLVSAGGTFPWQTLPGALIPLHHLLPMTYAVQGLRPLLYGGDLSRVWGDVGVLVAWMALGLVLSVLAVRRRRVWTGARLTPELVL